MILFALETSCDETSAAVVRDGRVLANVVSSQIKLHAEYGGVVPELAAREHLRNLAPVTRRALHEAQTTAAGLDAVRCKIDRKGDLLQPSAGADDNPCVSRAQRASPAFIGVPRRNSSARSEPHRAAVAAHGYFMYRCAVRDRVGGDLIIVSCARLNTAFAQR